MVSSISLAKARKQIKLGGNLQGNAKSSLNSAKKFEIDKDLMEKRITAEYSSKANINCNKVRKLVLQSLDAEKGQDNAAHTAMSKTATQFAA